MSSASEKRVERVIGHLSAHSTAEACAPSAKKGDIANVALNKEEFHFQEQVAAVKEWWQTPRFAHQTRPYTAEDVVRLRSPLMPTFASNVMAKKLWRMLQSYYPEGKYSHTFGSLDPIQVVQMSKYLTSIYVSGWQCSSTASTTNEPGPDLADYPYTTVPNKVDHLFRAQDFHSRKQVEERSWMSREERLANPPVDYFRPIIADGDTGHGGVGAVMRLTKLFIEAGAAGLHLEDQDGTSKKCGHMGGKVLVPTQMHIDRLVAARLQADLMGTDTLIVARTDAEAATLLNNNVDTRDHPFILGSTNESQAGLNQLLLEAQRRGASKDDQIAIMSSWSDTAGLMTYSEAVEEALVAKNAGADVIQRWKEQSSALSHDEAVALAHQFGVQPYWCWDKPRTREGHYRIRGGLEFCIARGIAYAPYADLIWMETKKPGIPLAAGFAKGIHAKFPHQMLAYNLSPSFWWDGAGMTQEQLASFQDDLGRIGYVWQFITLAGFHCNSLSIDRFSKDYADRKILAYIEGVQRKEKQFGVETLTHQKWSGAEYVDTLTKTVTGGLSSTTALQAGNTEVQFQEGTSRTTTSKPTEEQFDQVLS